jgi:glycyl-tRNA synthetase beta chain
LGLKPGTREHEILQGVFGASFDDLADTYDRYEQLRRLFRNDPSEFFKTAKVIERTANILKGAKKFEFEQVRTDLFQSELENELFQLIEGKGKEVLSLVKKRDYENATLQYGRIFFAPLNHFFDKVLVNAEDPAVRCNRHLLMLGINRIYTESLADLSTLSRLDQE